MHEHTNCILNWRFPRVRGTAWYIMRGLNVVCSTPQNKTASDQTQNTHGQVKTFASLFLWRCLLSLSPSHRQMKFFLHLRNTFFFLFLFFFTVFDTFLYFLNSYSIFLFPHVFFCYDLLNFELRKKRLKRIL